MLKFAVEVGFVDFVAAGPTVQRETQTHRLIPYNQADADWWGP
jgi:hypothetical protein